MLADNVECNRWSDTDMDQSACIFEVWYFVPASGVHMLAQIHELCVKYSLFILSAP